MKESSASFLGKKNYAPREGLLDCVRRAAENQNLGWRNARSV
jgi:hypothetical protein